MVSAKKTIYLSTLLLGLLSNTIIAQYNNTSKLEDNISEATTDTAKMYVYIDDGAHTEEEILLESLPTSTNQPVTIDQDKWNKLTDDKEFDYIKPQPPQPNQLNNWFYELINFLTQSGSWILYTVIVLLAIGIAYLIIKKLDLGYFINKKKDKNNHSITYDSNNNEVDYEKLIGESISSNNFADAVNYMYLHIVSLLQHHEALKLDDHTVNSQILHQLRAKDYFKLLKSQFQLFEWVYFGAYPIAPHQFNQYRQQYQILKEKITA